MPPMWLCVQIRPGMMMRPLASTVLVPAGILTPSAGPTATIFPSAMSSVPEAISSPAIGMILAPTKAVGGSAARARGAKHIAASSSKVTQREYRIGCFIEGSGFRVCCIVIIS